MEILFANSQIEKVCASKPTARKKYGERCADILFRRLAQMETAKDMEALICAPGHYHPLTGKRKGQWACRLQGGLRLIFAPGVHGELVLKEITGSALTILEIIDYHH